MEFALGQLGLFVPEIPTAVNERPVAFTALFYLDPSPIDRGINRDTKYKIAETFLKTFHRWPFSSCRSSRPNSYSEFLMSIGT